MIFLSHPFFWLSNIQSYWGFHNLSFFVHCDILLIQKLVYAQFYKTKSMKKLLLGIIGATFISIGAFAQTTYSIGDIVDDFTVTDIEGNTQHLYEITASGKHVYIDFFFDTCPPCQATSPIFGDFYDKYGCNGGDVYCIVMNNGTDPDIDVIAYEEEFGGAGHHAPAVSSDGGSGAVTDNFGVTAFPTYILIGPDNKLIEKDIYPIADITTFEATFYDGFTPSPMSCSPASVVEIPNLSDLNLYPNPANTKTSVIFSSKSETTVSISVFNFLGQIVETINTHAMAGENKIDIDLEKYQTGNYIVKVQLEDAIINAKLKVIK